MPSFIGRQYTARRTAAPSDHNLRGSAMTSRGSRRDFLEVCAAASALTLMGQAGEARAQAPAPRKGGTLRVGFYIEAATMDPHLSGSKIDRQIYHNIYEPLVTLDVKLGIKPGLAESWQQPDPKTLRKGEVANIDSVDVVDAYTIKVNLKKPDAALLATLTDRAGMMISPKVIQERGAELERNAKG